MAKKCTVRAALVSALMLASSAAMAWDGKQDRCDQFVMYWNNEEIWTAHFDTGDGQYIDFYFNYNQLASGTWATIYPGGSYRGVSITGGQVYFSPPSGCNPHPTIVYVNLSNGTIKSMQIDHCDSRGSLTCFGNPGGQWHAWGDC